MGAKDRILDYMRRVYLTAPDVWVHKATIEQLCKDAGYLGDQGTRRLRELVADKKLEKRRKGVSQELRYIPSLPEIAQIIDKV